MAVLAFIFVAVLSISSGAATGVITIVSVADDGGAANGLSFNPAISGDGRFVAFTSRAWNLVPNDQPCEPDYVCDDVFLHDRETGSTTRIANTPASAAALSWDGRFVAASTGSFGSPETFAVYVYDRLSGTGTPVSVDEDGKTQPAQFPSISADGIYVAFDTSAPLVSADTRVWNDVYVRDIRPHSPMVLVSGSLVGGSFYPSISADGDHIAFLGNCGELTCKVFIWDRDGGPPTAVPAPAGSIRNPSISGDGRLVAFTTNVSLVPEDTNGTFDVYVFDRSLETFERASVSSSGAQGTASSTGESISADGRHVVFRSEAPNLVPGDTNGDEDIFVRDRLAGLTERVNVDLLGREASRTNTQATDPAISGDGGSIAFDSAAGNLVPGDSGDIRDVFVRERNVAEQGCATRNRTLFIAIPGDGTVTLARSGSALTATGDGIGDQSCGGATVDNIDAVHVTGSGGAETFQVDLAGGAIAPGLATEADPPEIEIVVELGGGTDSLVVNGGPGNEQLALGEYGMNLNGDGDTDIVARDVERVEINGGSGNDAITGAGGSGTGRAWARPLELDGGAGRDTLVGGLAADVVSGGDANDAFRALGAADGADVFNGGGGTDTANYGTRRNGIRVSLDGAANDGSNNGAEGDNVGADVENVTGSRADDQIDDGGQSTTNVFAGGAGNDTIDAVDGIGNDRINGGAGTDACTADAGDTIVNCP